LIPGLTASALYNLWGNVQGSLQQWRRGRASCFDAAAAARPGFRKWPLPAPTLAAFRQGWILAGGGSGVPQS